MCRKIRTCLCSTCLNSCKCQKCDNIVTECQRYNRFNQISIFEELDKPKGNRTPRATWDDYNISKKRYAELRDMICSGKYALIVHWAAHTANKDIAEYILLSVIQNKSYDALRIKWELREMEQIPYCRTDFYGIRRYFFSIFDKEMRRIGK